MNTLYKQARLLVAWVLFAVVAGAATTIKADSFTFNGTFTRDDEVQFFDFSVVTASLVTARTLSAARGGFDPVLSLFDASGLLIDSNDDVAGAAAPDALLEVLLQPGRYQLGLSQYDNFARGPYLSDGFLREGEAAFTREFAAAAGATGLFYDANGYGRGASFELEIGNVAEAVTAVPEPATLLLTGTGLAGIGATIRKKRRSS